jgi:hypothetical protein
MKNKILRFQASAVVWLSPSLFYDVTQRGKVDRSKQGCLTLEDGNRRPETSVPNYQPMPRQHPRRAKASRINFVQDLRFSYRRCSMFKCSEMLLCRYVNNYRRLEEPQYLHLLGQTVREDFFTASYCFRKRSPDVTHTVDGRVIVEILVLEETIVAFGT